MKITIKKIFMKSLSGFLALMTLVGLLASLSMLPVLAAPADDGDGEKEVLSFYDKYNNYYTDPNKGDADFTTEEKRLAAMGDVYFENKNFELYIDRITGEVALKDKYTGDILFTNPYDIAEYPLTRSDSNTKVIINQSIKQKLLSQVHIYFVDNGTTKEYNSFKDAALLQQIKLKRLNGGVRVEYSIGEEESRTLVPRVISKTRYEDFLLAQLESNLEGGKEATIYKRFTAWYIEKNPFNETVQEIVDKMHKEYPITEKMAVYVFDTTAKAREIKQVEAWIKAYCPKYTYEELDKDHRETEYKESNIAPANFKMALEYYLTDNGVEVRFPANGLTFDESNYQLTSLEILQYMGAGSTYYNGYTFIPDGSGSLTRFEDTKNYTTQGGKVYGQDYAYQEIGNQNQQIFRMPVFGVVTTDTVRKDVDVSGFEEKRNKSTGYVAIVTEGDALTNISSVHGGKVYCYSSVYCSFNPRPKDSYNLAEAISIGSNSKYTVVSKRKYTGSFRINYIMLTDNRFAENTENAAKVAEAKANGRNFYEATYVGMAKAYREFLERKGDLTRIKDAKENIPLYVEVFGLTETDESFASIPITVKKALTSFENLQTMVTELSTAKSPITNIAFRLKGFTNGGLVPTIPSKVKFEKVVGGNKGFKNFLKFAAEHGIEVYPEFDFVYMQQTGMFDGFSFRKHAVKTIDNRYITKRVYDPVLQSFTESGKICVSPSVFRGFFEGFTKSMNKIVGEQKTFISVGTFGSDLNSDFDEDDPYNREDSKEFTKEILSQVEKNYNKVLVDSGNAFSLPYASVVLNAPLDSSRFLSASESVPFFGMAFHGYIVIAGAPTNMAGDIKYETLKIIENGATLYMMFSYQNVELLKEDPELSKYYAISYEIWKNSLLSQYDEEGKLVSLGLYDKLNNALKDVQTSPINDHRFITCNRELTEAETKDIIADARIEYNKALAFYTERYNHFVAKLNDYERIMRDYTGDERETLLALYGLNKTDLENNRNQYKMEIDLLENGGFEKIVERRKGEINLVIDDGSVVYVEYENGHWFVLNYNNYVVEVEVNGVKMTIAAKDFYDSKANA